MHERPTLNSLSLPDALPISLQHRIGDEIQDAIPYRVDKIADDVPNTAPSQPRILKIIGNCFVEHQPECHEQETVQPENRSEERRVGKERRDRNGQDGEKEET